MPKWMLLVEGEGERKAAPYLVRRILQEKFQRFDFSVKSYTANGKGNISNESQLKIILNRIRKDPECQALIILLDADKDDLDCPPQLAKSIADRTKDLALTFSIVIVVAVCEYESWFLYNLELIAPKYFENPEIVKYEANAEEECSAKGWLERHMPKGRSYKESIDQEKMTALIDIEKTYLLSRSFKRLVDAIGELLDAIDNRKITFSPD